MMIQIATNCHILIRINEIMNVNVLLIRANYRITKKKWTKVTSGQNICSKGTFFSNNSNFSINFRFKQKKIYWKSILQKHCPRLVIIVDVVVAMTSYFIYHHTHTHIFRSLVQFSSIPFHSQTTHNRKKFFVSWKSLYI